MSDSNETTAKPNLNFLDDQNIRPDLFENTANPEMISSSQPNTDKDDLLTDNNNLFSSSLFPPVNLPTVEDPINLFNFSPTLQRSLIDSQAENLDENKLVILDEFESPKEAPSDPIDQESSHGNDFTASLVNYDSPNKEFNELNNEANHDLMSSAFDEGIKGIPEVSNETPLFQGNESSLSKQQEANVLFSNLEDKDSMDYSQKKDDKDDVGNDFEFNAKSNDDEINKPPGGEMANEPDNHLTHSNKEDTDLFDLYSQSSSQLKSQSILENLNSNSTESSDLKMNPNDNSGSSDPLVTSTCESSCISAWFSPEKLHPKVSNVIYWRDVQKSGIIFTIGLTLLLSLVFCSVISVFAYTSLLTLSATLSFRIYKSVLQAIQKSNDEKPFEQYLELDFTLSSEKVHRFVDNFLGRFNNLLKRVKSIFLVEDIFDSLKYFIGFWCLTYLGSWFNGLTLVILTYLAIFSVPKLYEINKEHVDHYFSLACSQTQNVISKIKSKIPFPGAASKEKNQ